MVGFTNCSISKGNDKLSLAFLLFPKGVVKQDCNDFSYIIEDSTRMCERIWREDIITDYDDANQIIQVLVYDLDRKMNTFGLDD